MGGGREKKRGKIRMRNLLPSFMAAQAKKRRRRYIKEGGTDEIRCASASNWIKFLLLLLIFFFSRADARERKRLSIIKAERGWWYKEGSSTSRIDPDLPFFLKKKEHIIS